MASVEPRPTQGRYPAPNRSVVIVTGDKHRLIAPKRIQKDQIGLKAMGLLTVPKLWVPEFFVVSADKKPTKDATHAAGVMAGLNGLSDVYVRSSGTLEGIEERGSLESRACALDEVVDQIAQMNESLAKSGELDRQKVHFVVQRRVVARAKGHLSNERHLSRHARDWHLEIEGSAEDMESLGVRRWRDASSPSEKILKCKSRATISRSLRSVASWILPHRAHLEWVWDGKVVWIVQLDFLIPRLGGVSPESLVSRDQRLTFTTNNLSAFIVAGSNEFEIFPKLKNARTYGQLGYAMPQFFVLRNEKMISSILSWGQVHRDLKHDLEALCKQPFVLRTDAQGLAKGERQMLPRSDELRSADSAINWLKGPFRSAMRTLKDAKDIVLIGHHFIPAAASAWCQAKPYERRVRVESLWGIPEGIYYYAHDVYDVDTMQVSVNLGNQEACRILSSRERYKGKFIAPNGDGDWKVHLTAEGPDWSNSIRKTAWIQEIAWTSRRIAEEVGHPVVVMWFVDLPKAHSKHKVLPWYHEPWEPASSGYKRAVHRKKLLSSELREVRTKTDWTKLRADVANGSRVERVYINPDDSALVRDREFIEELSSHAREHRYIIELSGGLLSHAFYMLVKHGCDVECIDLFGVDEETIDFNKIVRDRIPEDIEARGEGVETIQLEGDALVEAIKRKLVEESFEVSDAATADSIAEELADVQEVIDAMAVALDIGKREIADIQKRKRERRGGFANGLMLVRTSIAPPIGGEGLSRSDRQQRTISRVDDLPSLERDFHIDHRVDVSGSPERQITITMPAQLTDYSAGNHRFELNTTNGTPHEMFFNAKVERDGANLRLRVRLTNAANQLDLPLGSHEELAEKSKAHKSKRSSASKRGRRRNL